MTINEQELTQLRDFLWRTGKFRDPSRPEALNVKAEDVQKLTLGDAALREAVASMQAGDANMEVQSILWHGRTARADGDPGPATLALMTIPRCPVPDHPPLPGESFDYGDPEVNRVAESYSRFAASKIEPATGKGSWPPGCHGTPSVHEVTISHDLTRAPAKVKDWFPEIKRRLYAAFAAVGVVLREVPVGDPSANIRQSFKGLTGSTIGLAEFNSQRCGDSVFCYLDPSYAPNLEMVLTLALHEVGHNMNEEHRPGGIMNPSILETRPVWVERDAAGKITYRDKSYLTTLTRSFGGEPVGGPITPPPGTPSDGLVPPLKVTDANGKTMILQRV